MERIVERLRRGAAERDLDYREGEVFALIELMGCMLCCRDGARGGNKDCGPKVIEEIEA